MRVCVYPPYITWPFYIMQHNYPFVESLIKALSMPRWSELHILTFPPVYILDGGMYTAIRATGLKFFGSLKNENCCQLTCERNLFLDQGTRNSTNFFSFHSIRNCDTNSRFDRDTERRSFNYVMLGDGPRCFSTNIDF